MSDAVRAAFPSGPLLDPATGEVTPAWRGFFVALYTRTGAAPGTSTGGLQSNLEAEAAARIAGDANLQGQIDHAATGATNAVIMQTGRSGSDSLAAVLVTLPVPYRLRTLSFLVDGSPTEPEAFFSQAPGDVLTTSLATGKLQKIDTSSGTVIDVPATAFTWYATGV